MTGESQLPPKAEPDPTIATNDAVERAVKAERDYVDGAIHVIEERLRSMDVATRLLNETVNRVPTDLEKAITQVTAITSEQFSSVNKVMDEKFAGVDRQFAASDKAVSAAFQAQEKQATASEVANQKAIDKSEKATNEAALKDREANAIGRKAQDDKIDDLKDRVTRGESMKAGGAEATTVRQQNQAAVIAAVGVGIALILATITIVGFVIGGGQ